MLIRRNSMHGMVPLLRRSAHACWIACVIMAVAAASMSCAGADKPLDPVVPIYLDGNFLCFRSSFADGDCVPLRLVSDRFGAQIDFAKNGAYVWVTTPDIS